MKMNPLCKGGSLQNPHSDFVCSFDIKEEIYMSKEYEEIIIKAMAYDLILLFNEKSKDTMYSAKEIENIIIEYVSKSLAET